MTANHVCAFHGFYHVCRSFQIINMTAASRRPNIQITIWTLKLIFIFPVFLDSSVSRHSTHFSYLPTVTGSWPSKSWQWPILSSCSMLITSNQLFSPFWRSKISPSLQQHRITSPPDQQLRNAKNCNLDSSLAVTQPKHLAVPLPEHL